MFSRHNPLNSFKWNEHLDNDFYLSSDELFKTAVKKYPEFDKVILIAIYHLINTQNAKYEYITIMTKDLRLISDLVKGNKWGVDIPENVKRESSENILLTCHNHFKRSILPSSKDLKNIFKPNIKFTIIVSENHIGIIIH